MLLCFVKFWAGIRNFSSCIGTTTVTVAVIDAADTEIFKRDLKVKVKKNAADVTVTGIADGDKFSVGQTVDVTLPRAGVDTDERELTVDNAEIAEIKLSEKARTYTVKFLKAGEATFTAKAYQSAKYPAATQSKTIKVTVGNPVPTDVKVVASNAFELKFAEDVEALGLFKDVKEIPTDAIYYVINDTKVSFSAVSGIKATGNTVKVTMYDNFTSGTEYSVVINGSEPKSFKVAGTAAKDVVSIEIVSNVVTAGDADATITIALYNADGIDIYPNVKDDYITTSITDYTKASISGRNLYISNVGDAVDVKADYKFYDTADNYKEISCTTTKKITAVAAPSDVKTGKVYTIEPAGFDAVGKLNKDYAGKNFICVGDTDYTFSVYLIGNNNGTDKSILVDGTNKFGGKALTVKTVEEKVAMIQANAGLGKYTIVGNEVGSTNVFVGYYDDNNNWVTVDVCPIEVKAERYPAKFEATPNKTTLNRTNGLDQIEYTLKVFDQYGDKYVKQAVEYEFAQNTQSSTNYGACAIAKATFTGETKFYVVPGSITPAAGKDNGSVNGTLKLTNWFSKANTVNVNFSWADKGTVADSIAFTNIKDSTLDTSITANSSIKIAQLQVMGKKGGYDAGEVALVGYTKKDGTVVGKVITKEEDVPKVGAVSAAALCIAVRKDGSIIDPGSADYAPFINTTTLTVTPVAVDGNNEIKKLAKGTYTFSLYEVKNGKPEAPKVVTINVTDNQQAATYKQIAEKVDSTSIADISKAIELYFGSTKLTNIKVFSTQNNAGSVYVSGAKAYLPVTLKINDVDQGAGLKYEVSITIGKLLKINQ